MQTGTLYLIPNTLGNATDIDAASLALFDVIPKNVQQKTALLSHFVAENAKTTRAFLKLINVNFPLVQPLQSIAISELNINTKTDALPALIAPLLTGIDVGLISEAGVPAVADPGANLVRLAHQNGINVRPLVGPSSLLLAVMASGLNGQSFAFNGYLPTDAALRAKRIQELEQRAKKEMQTQLFIETPYRNATLLEAFCEKCQPQTQLCIATDLTLETEKITTKSMAEWKKLVTAGKAPDLNKKPTVFLML